MKTDPRAGVPENFRLTEGQARKALADNARLLRESNSPFLTLSPRERERARGLREAPEWREALERLDAALYSALGTPGYETLRARRDVTAGQLAEAHAATGRFDLAAAVCPDPLRAAELDALWRAVMRDDDEACGDECREAFDADPTLLTRETVLREVYSVKHGREMPAVRCEVCKELNVRPLPAEIGRQRAARKQAAALVAGLSRPEAIAALTRAGLTAEEVFG
jgi:hypothetical protein